MGIAIGEYASLGIGKETAFGTKATPNIFYGLEAFSPQGRNNFLVRSGAKKRPGRSYPTTSGFVGTLTARLEAQPDTVPQILAYAFGYQAAPVQQGTTTAYSSAYNFKGSSILTVLPSFTMEFNRGGTDTIAFLGCTVESVKIAAAPNSPVQCDLTICYVNEQIVAAPTTPSFSNQLPYAIENTTVTYNNHPLNASNTSPAMRKFEITLANNLNKNYRTSGSRLVTQFPLGARVVSASVTLGFENTSAQQDFWGTANNPSSLNVVGVPFSVVMQNFGNAAPTYPYSLTLSMPNCAIESAPVPYTTSALEQTLTLQGYETSAGSGDDLTCTVVNTASTVY